MEKYLEKQRLFEQFIEFSAKNGVKRDNEGLKISGSIIYTQLKAYIARNMLDNNGFYQIWRELDTSLKSAIDFLENKK
jgi:carboxyl-terminal processing protease